jgi:hypothetical protein
VQRGLNSEGPAYGVKHLEPIFTRGWTALFAVSTLFALLLVPSLFGSHSGRFMVIFHCMLHVIPY